MALDVSYVNRQADRLSDAESYLASSKKLLTNYKITLNEVWTDKSVNKVIKKIDNIIKDINAAMDDCKKIKSNIKEAARDIRNEEIAEAERIQRELEAQKAKEAEKASPQILWT